MSITYRPLTVHDVRLLSPLAQLLPTPWSPQALEETLRQKTTQGWAACANDQCVGFILVMVLKPEGEILGIAVDPAFQKKGIGENLLAHALHHLAHKGIDRIFLEVGTQNHPALSLYKKTGFQEIGTRKGYYVIHDDDALVLSLDLIR